MRGMLATASLNDERMQAAADGPAAAAVDLAEWLVERGMPFRQAHALVGGLVRDSLERHVPLAELVEAHPALGDGGGRAARARGGGHPAAHRPVAPDPARWPSSRSGSPGASRSTAPGSPSGGCRGHRAADLSDGDLGDGDLGDGDLGDGGSHRTPNPA